jgi:alkanesulfonate monooxygenase SsuD/methylene tetrahydromethanopterin reductase-like flavin-dependent oxidoreductase (luciferase family)
MSMKKIGFLSFGHWTPSPQSQTRSASDALLQSIDLAVAAEELGADGAYFRVHHFARPNPRPMFPNPPGLLRVEPYSQGLRERIWWGAGSNATAGWAAKLGMNLQSSTLKNDESGRPFHIQQAEQIRIFREAWRAAGHGREPRVSVSRSIFALVDDRDRAYFGRGNENDDQIGLLGDNTRAIFGRSYAAEPDILVEQLAKDEAIAGADTLLLTVPNQLGVDYNAHVIEVILKHVAPGLGWR